MQDIQCKQRVWAKYNLGLYHLAKICQQNSAVARHECIRLHGKTVMMMKMIKSAITITIPCSQYRMSEILKSVQHPAVLCRPLKQGGINFSESEGLCLLLTLNTVIQWGLDQWDALCAGSIWSHSHKNPGYKLYVVWKCGFCFHQDRPRIPVINCMLYENVDFGSINTVPSAWGSHVYSVPLFESSLWLDGVLPGDV